MKKSLKKSAAVFLAIVLAFAPIISKSSSDIIGIEKPMDSAVTKESFVSRGEFAKMLCDALPDKVTTELYYEFSDVDNNHWANEYIQKAVNAMWLLGYGDNTFRPDDNITYEQAVTVVCRAFDIANEYYSYPEDYITKAIEYAITDNVNALIGECITRSQAQMLISNAIEYEKESLTEYEPLVSYSTGIQYSGWVLSGDSYVGKYETADADYDSWDGYDQFYNYYNTEEYVSEEENIFKDTVTSPLSTFSIDTDTASYSNLRRFILTGQNIPAGAVRSEELINYFTYKKAETEKGKPFGVNYTVDICPWNSENKLAMITVSGEEMTEYKPSNLVFLIDTSGSMSSYNKLPLVKQALSMLLDNLGENDRISIVTYASGTGVLLEPTSATEKETILNALNSLNAYGFTSGAAGINLAYEQAEKFKGDGNNRIILCTDGDFNVGISSTADLEKLIEEKRNSGIYLSVLGFGMDNYKDNKMETLADKGNGNYAYIDNLREAKKVLVDEMSKTIYTIAKDVKIQVEFNPETVEKYRLIGYENRILNNEDFENDEKDAGELGAGATVTVLYEIVPRRGEMKNSLKYQTVTTNGSLDLMNIKIRYKLPNGEESEFCEYPLADMKNEELNADFTFAAAVAELGMILNDSEFKGSANYESVISLARGSIGEDKYGLRCEFVQLVDLLKYKQNQ
ncbi:MAG: von Willebrand factor type A domain-containing protein [Clostridia bacterium]